MSSTRAPSYPRAENSAVATSRISVRVRSRSRVRSTATSPASRVVLMLKLLTVLTMLGPRSITNVLVRTLAEEVGVLEPRRYLVGLIGASVATSLSPPLHEREADELGLRYVYQVLDLDVLGLDADD